MHCRLRENASGKPAQPIRKAFRIPSLIGRRQNECSSMTQPFDLLAGVSQGSVAENYPGRDPRKDKRLDLLHSVTLSNWPPVKAIAILVLDKAWPMTHQAISLP